LSSVRSSGEAEHDASIALWLTQLRWIAVAGQLLVIGLVWFFLRIPLPLQPLLGLVFLTVLSNVGLWLWVRRSLRLPTPLSPVGANGAEAMLRCFCSWQVLSVASLAYVAVHVFCFVLFVFHLFH
jgi:hypothetical protein